MPSPAETIAALQGLNPVTTPQSPADPYAAAMTFGSAIGLPDAIKALKGQMTPEEAQMFAVTSAMGMIPGAAPEKAAVKTMGELLPHLYPEASSFAKMTPKEYLGMFGSDLPKQLPQDVENVLKPYMQPAKAGKVPGPGPKNMFESLLQSGKEKYGQDFAADISDEAISKKLTSNPGSSIFDVANTHVGGQSSPVSKDWGWPGVEQTFPQSIFRDIPREGGIQYTPTKASILGKSENLVHGTRLPQDKWYGGIGTDTDALKLPDDELGVHFGNPKQAQVFSGDWLSHQAQPRQYPVVVSTNNPLELPDLGTWHLGDVAGALKKANAGELRGKAGYERYPADQSGYNNQASRVPISPETKGMFPDHEVNQIDSIEGMRDYLQSKGYDSIKYVNKAEDSGYPSYIKFAPSPEAPNFVSGVRSPFAAFDPAKIMRPELAAGLAGGTLAAPAIDPNLLKALTGNQTDQQQ